jgi:uncharacterized protein YndB with AHSA1/START domain
MDKPEFVYVSLIGAPPEKVFAALTQPEFTQKYFGRRSIQCDWKIGSPVKLVMEDGKVDWQGEVLAYDPPKKLSYTFQPQQRPELEAPSRVTFTLDPMGPVTRLTIVHDQFAPGSADYEKVRGGWPGILSNMNTLLETGKPLIDRWG